MSIAFVLGNGVSRRGLPLNDLQQHGPIYGCNALHRDFVPDVLIATDKPMAMSIEESGYPLKHKFYTRRPMPAKGALPVPKEYFGFSSGPIAVALAAMEQHRKIYMIGFDMGPVENKKFNNIYADSEHYKKADSAPTFTGNWVKQIQQVCKNFGETQFIRVYGSSTARFQELDSIRNMKHLSLNELIDRLNKLKDF